MKRKTEYVNLSEALRRLKAKWPWAPVQALRKRVESGDIKSVRSSNQKGARYYVKLVDLERAIS